MILHCGRTAGASRLTGLLRVADRPPQDLQAAVKICSTFFRLQLSSGVLAQAEVETQTPEYEVCDTLKVIALVSHFRSRGHLVAQLDPLQRVPYGTWHKDGDAEAVWADCGLSRLLSSFTAATTPAAQAEVVADYLKLRGSSSPDRRFWLEDPLLPRKPSDQQWWTLPEIVERLRSSYCGTLAVELDHVFKREQQRWLVERLEQRHIPPASERLSILRHLLQADTFERTLALKFPQSKRFGLEGLEALMPGMIALVERCAQHGVQRMEVGMPHRGRLSLLCNLLGKPPGALFGEMEGRQSEFHVGDVKYHLGQSATLACPIQVPGEQPEPAQQSIRVSIAPNPSHLEAVSPVVLGMVRAEQMRARDTDCARIMGLLIHGDAAFSGLGLVSESLQLSNVPGFSTGGTIHIVLNNQVGFTTGPAEARSCPHPSDVGKIVGAPILHVNADDPDAVVQACIIAADWRAFFKRDIVIDIVGYRRLGHNEQDNPVTTLPLSYTAIAAHPPVLQLYGQQLEEDGIINQDQLRTWQDKSKLQYDEDYEAYKAGKYRETAETWLSSSWQGDALQALAGGGSVSGAIEVHQEPTGLPLGTLQWVGSSLCQVPEGFNIHPDMAQLTERRRKMFETKDSRVDWATAEQLAFGTLVLKRHARPPGSTAQPGEGLNKGHYSVRLTGQDAERGTFNQRHFAVYDQTTGQRHVSLNNIKPCSQEMIEVWNSPLNEAGVLGFEYGFSLGIAGSGLVAWEAQFGDFANNAQAMVDQFVSAAEERWGQQSGLVLMLPHGYDGQGPDHSSARPERFLSLSNDDADHLPGHSPSARRQIAATFAAIAGQHGGKLDRKQAMTMLAGLTGGSGDQQEAAELLWIEMGLAPDALVTQEKWEGLMVQYMRRNAEQQANIFVVNATTPAQYFHVLRRQLNRPYNKPLVLFTPKALLHHRPFTSALKDFSTGTFFNRVIDDGKVSDNTRHLAKHPKTGEPFLLPADQIRRVVLCSGQIYYALSNARRAKRIRNVVFVRLEQIAPFPHDLLVKVIQGYPAAELVWCQEEPKNMGAWMYVKPRLETALRDLTDCAEAPQLHYIGRPTAASPATASMAIHQAEMSDIVRKALSEESLCEQEGAVVPLPA